MRKLLIAILLFCGSLSGCQSKKQQTETAQTSAADSSATKCYAYYTDKDTVRLTMTQTGESVSGDLMYQLSGKDRNTGTISGRLQGDTLLADYTFQSEGVESVREVAFLTKDGGLVEGYAPVAEQNSKMVFSDRNALKFTSNMPLRPISCP